MNTLDDLPKMVPASWVAEHMNVPIDSLLTAAARGEFARVYVFGRRKFFALSEIPAALKELVPGDPTRARRAVLAADAAAPCQARRPRRAMRRPQRGSNAGAV